MASEAEEQLSDLRALVRSRGWDRLLKLAEVQCNTRTTQLLAPLDSANPYPQEFSKGEIAGIRLFTKLPGMAIEAIEAEMKEQEIREEGGDHAE